MSAALLVSSIMNVIIAIAFFSYIYKQRKENSIEYRYAQFIRKIAHVGNHITNVNFKCGNGCYLGFINHFDGTFTLKYWCAHERNRLYKVKTLGDVLKVLNDIRLIVITNSNDIKINNALFDLVGDPYYD